MALDDAPPPPPPAPLRPRLGLCSVTFRQLPAAEVAALAGGAGLDIVEWGADVHAPPEDLAAVREVARLTADHGLTTSSYGSYFRATPGEDFRPVAAAAMALGAGRVRVWAGTDGSTQADAGTRRSVADALRAAGAVAADHGVELALEYHKGTLTDTAASTLDLLDAVGRTDVRTYWQPPEDMPDDEAVADLRRVLDRVSGVHVFSWWPGNTRHRLARRADLWRQVFAVLHARGGTTDALLEFVPGDDPALLPREAHVLRALAAGAEEPA